MYIDKHRGFDPLVFDGMLLYDSLVLKFRRSDISRFYSLQHLLSMYLHS
ncbi:hypothetical protein HanRHA438_Chr07g0313781 [Helianthus annuus]|uniref:Uncharacterized protein n=1 Tax=Helianthus annuus TaxID=4232 RepID=A0A9K3IMT5_HELAN|nr:hypothetical protein HanXRQr2_Chr07g0303891 [Helianthus annuus]KAJ0563798.1 hypothetical protein HanHA89_Chr07g0267151 [Helianthus annuus]KAJ0731874.1 hypothetical protein HanOQP8_Chr07g0256891 [Helianthus annuus]KAJ0905455.1 hypothetical protein HanPSC8_Chr07g0294201 [Helianthus annuus]KAJ0908738.1 hypothetical protein HanRHA438_Chr07g0313781 [Helianthus annuus]